MTLNFGKYAILKPVEHTFEKEPGWKWHIKPVTTGEELAISQFLNTERVAVLPDGSRIGRPATNLEVACREIALCFASTNIPGDNGEPILQAGASVDEIEAVLRQMPNEMVKELWDAVGEAIPGWGPMKPTKKTASS